MPRIPNLWNKIEIEYMIKGMKKQEREERRKYIDDLAEQLAIKLKEK